MSVVETPPLQLERFNWPCRGKSSPQKLLAAFFRPVLFHPHTPTCIELHLPPPSVLTTSNDGCYDGCLIFSGRGCLAPPEPLQPCLAVQVGRPPSAETARQQEVWWEGLACKPPMYPPPPEWSNQPKDNLQVGGSLH